MIMPEPFAAALARFALDRAQAMGAEDGNQCKQMFS